MSDDNRTPDRASMPDDEIDLIDLLRTVWSERRLILSMVAAGAVIGLVVGLSSTKQYNVTSTLMPEYSTESQGGASSLLRQFGGLAGLAGGSYNATSSALRVELYPDIVQTLPFQKQLMHQTFYVPEVDSMASLYDYFTEIRRPSLMGTVMSWTFGLPGKALALLRTEEQAGASAAVLSEDVMRLTPKEWGVAGQIKTLVSASLDKRSGIISIQVTMPDPVLAANVTHYVVGQLTTYLIQYRTEKLQRDLTFTQDRLAEARVRYERAGIALSTFRESQQGTASARMRQGEQFLQSEYDLAFGVYNTLTQQIEQQRLKLQEETPVFKTLQPVVLPNQPAGQGTAFMIVVSVFISGFMALMLIFLKRVEWSRISTSDPEPLKD
jgi:uncharacterized protein involved in exopolysaccharide biosynthesis